MNWNSAEEVAAVAAAKYGLCIASDVRRLHRTVQLLTPTQPRPPSLPPRHPTPLPAPLLSLQVAYYSPDVAPLAAALRAVGATTSVVVAPMHR